MQLVPDTRVAAVPSPMPTACSSPAIVCPAARPAAPHHLRQRQVAERRHRARPRGEGAAGHRAARRQGAGAWAAEGRGREPPAAAALGLPPFPPRPFTHSSLPYSTFPPPPSQEEREAALKDFKDGVYDILIATDVAARGLDIKDVAQVINYDMPSEIDRCEGRVHQKRKPLNQARPSPPPPRRHAPYRAHGSRGQVRQGRHLHHGRRRGRAAGPQGAPRGHQAARAA